MPLIVWSEPASKDFAELIEFARAQHSANIAVRRLNQIADAVERLLVWPHYGQPVHGHRNLRRLYVRFARCHVYYRIRMRNMITVVRLESELQRSAFERDNLDRR